MSALENFSNSDARESISLALRLHGSKRGASAAAQLLGVSERTVRAIIYGETNGATVDPDRAFTARMALRRQRAEQIRAELRQLEIEDAANLASNSAYVGMGR